MIQYKASDDEQESLTFHVNCDVEAQPPTGVTYERRVDFVDENN
jgi:hypothetical protein